MRENDTRLTHKKTKHHKNHTKMTQIYIYNNNYKTPIPYFNIKKPILRRFYNFLRRFYNTLFLNRFYNKHCNIFQTSLIKLNK
jgi:hypothetical protein